MCACTGIFAPSIKEHMRLWRIGRDGGPGKDLRSKAFLCVLYHKPAFFASSSAAISERTAGFPRPLVFAIALPITAESAPFLPFR